MLVRYSSLLTTGISKPRCVFTQDWLNSSYSLPALSCLFIGSYKHSDECSWRWILVVSPWLEIHGDFIVVFFFYFVYDICCWILSYLSITFSFTHMVFILVDFDYRFNVKRCCTISISVTIFSKERRKYSQFYADIIFFFLTNKCLFMTSIW